MLKRVKQLAADNQAYVVELRRYFHMHPESSLQEFETCKRIQQELTDIGVPFRVVRDIGVIADIEGGRPGKLVALRADIDALEIDEKNDVPYKSTVPGKMHACGHDSHAAMLLGAAKVLKAIQGELAGTVRLIFQPAEETLAGAKIMIEAGCLEGVDRIFGIHISSGNPVGKADCLPGPRMAAADAMTIEVTGQSGHGSRPDLAVDAVVATAAIVMNLQTVVSRETNPLDSAVVSVGQMHAGTRINIIANKGVMEVSIRSFLPETRAKLNEQIKRIATRTGEALGCKVDCIDNYGTPPCINEEKSTELAQAAILEVLGEDALMQKDKATGSEDFAYYVEKVPGAFCMLGAALPSGPRSAHHEEFDVEESTFKDGVAIYTMFALKALEA
ncbi:MAG: amidohydrolase [Clostridiales bacterium]|nr:amidohydrolase [Clostridiales bacterium]